MMSIQKLILCGLIAVVLQLSSSCQDEDERYIHTDTNITSIYIRDAVGGVYVEGHIQDNGQITFEIPLSKRPDIDNTHVLIYANIPVSASVSPGFAGRHDLSSPQQFTVTNDDNNPKTYTLQAVYLNY